MDDELLTESESEPESEDPASPGHVSSDAERMTTGSRWRTVSVGTKVEVTLSVILLPWASERDGGIGGGDGGTDAAGIGGA